MVPGGGAACYRLPVLRWRETKASLFWQLSAKIKGPGARAGERSFGRHPQQLVHDRNSFTTSALRRERVCSGGCKRTSTSPGSWPLKSPEVVNESLGWQPKERSPSLGPGPLIRRS